MGSKSMVRSRSVLGESMMAKFMRLGDYVLGYQLLMDIKTRAMMGEARNEAERKSS